ncbi:hypothetical protein AYI69_g11323 [Smittium culicis]|uniref:26S proteasome complex subunit SEM1 n=1 Tax=Smittium culicis TaxID=133412 RepID=A0A1R1WZH0_9FUNG|nr:hypothetical protein AYI69_g11323 [Smittium culicis]
MEVVNEAEQEKILSNLDEDVEFEEFEAEDWSEDEKDKEDLNLWEEDWDDDDLEDDFSKQLSLTEKIESSVAALWKEHPNFENLDLSNSNNIIPRSPQLLDAPKEQNKAISSPNPENVENSLSLIEDLKNKLWYSRSEIAVALDAVILLLETPSTSTQESNEPPTFEGTSKLDSNLLMMDSIINERPSDQEKSYQLMISLGEKQKQLESSSEYLSDQSTRLKNIIKNSKSDFLKALALRRKYWPIQHYESKTLGSKFFIPYAHNTCNLILSQIFHYGQQGTANLNICANSSLNDTKCLLDSGNSNSNDFISISSKLPVSNFSSHLTGKCKNSNQVCFSRSSFTNNLTLPLLDDNISLINDRLLYARSSSYANELFKRLQHEALYFSKGTVSTQKSFQKSTTDSFSQNLHNSNSPKTSTDINHHNDCQTDLLTIPLSLADYSLSLQFRITRSFSDNEFSNKAFIFDLDSQGPSKSYEATCEPALLRIVPELTQILSYKFLIKQFQHESLKRIGTLSSLGSNPHNLLPVIESLKCLFVISQVDNFLVKFCKLWKSLTKSSITLNSSYVGFDQKGKSQIYYSSCFSFSQSQLSSHMNSILIKLISYKVCNYINSNPSNYSHPIQPNILVSNSELGNQSDVNTLKSFISDRFFFNSSSGITSGTIIFNDNTLVNASFTIDLESNFDSHCKNNLDLDNDKTSNSIIPTEKNLPNQSIGMEIDSVNEYSTDGDLKSSKTRSKLNAQEGSAFKGAVKVNLQLIVFKKVSISKHTLNENTIQAFNGLGASSSTFKLTSNKLYTCYYRSPGTEIVNSLQQVEEDPSDNNSNKCVNVTFVDYLYNYIVSKSILN